MAAYESVILVKPEVQVYSVPPRSSNRAVRYVLYLEEQYGGDFDQVFEVSDGIYYNV